MADKKRSRPGAGAGRKVPTATTEPPPEDTTEWPEDLWGLNYNPNVPDHPYGPVSSFMERVHKNEYDRCVYSMMSGFDINDDRQHIPGVKFDMSPLYFAVGGSKDHGIAPNSNAKMVSLLLAHPQINPDCGFTRWDGKGNFVRNSPLSAAVSRLAKAKKAFKTHVQNDPNLLRSWQDACAIVEKLARYTETDVGFGTHTRRVSNESHKNDSWESPLEELLATKSKALDCVLMLLLSGA
jgi:hypothetical protein